MDYWINFLYGHATLNQQDFLVRVVQNRVTTEECKLFDKVNQETPAGTIIAHIPKDTRRNLPKREATLEIRYIRMLIQAPAKTPKKYIKNKSGCEIEKLQNRTSERLQKLILIYSIISVRILGLIDGAVWGAVEVGGFLGRKGDGEPGEKVI